jgi:putative redox protein
MVTHNVKTDFNGGMSFTADINGHKVSMDSNDADGNNTGPSPKRLMLASLAGCTGIDIVTILNKMKVPFSGFSIEINASLTEAHPRIYKDVKIIYTIKLPESGRPKMEKAVKLSQDKYCGVTAMFRAFARLETEIIYL